MNTIDDPARELRRVVDRCAGLPLARWSRPDETGRTPAERVHDSCQRLEALAARAQGREVRTVPTLRPHGLADQVSVLAREALAVADPDQVAALLADLRRSL